MTPSRPSTYLTSWMSVWIVELSSSLVMCVGLRVRPSPFASALTTLSNWSPNRGIPSTGTAWYTACRRLFCPPWVMKRRVCLWPEVNKEKKEKIKKKRFHEIIQKFIVSVVQIIHNAQNKRALWHSTMYCNGPVGVWQKASVREEQTVPTQQVIER